MDSGGISVSLTISPDLRFTTAAGRAGGRWFCFRVRIAEMLEWSDAPWISCWHGKCLACGCCQAQSCWIEQVTWVHGGGVRLLVQTKSCKDDDCSVEHPMSGVESWQQWRHVRLHDWHHVLVKAGFLIDGSDDLAGSMIPLARAMLSRTVPGGTFSPMKWPFHSNPDSDR